MIVGASRSRGSAAAIAGGDGGIAELPVVERLAGRRRDATGSVAESHELPAELVEDGLGPAERG